ncbi:Cys regulon transcriptional activator CysB [Candidatus Rhodobacter oscarellae]|uniref:Cys regulon transcriptional activator CysB n=1 Tax=Candidatus Rhodobacter oscarellae TaxID=1675527 RepID=A0A0J9EAV3_9RHOB|nr:LysR family transcriptional regulator [Candidatus Rhodobacter lobularis]KMW58799.1 Cys regulon transcriptional activator CysB [Candidatus Rhodobacter lobularis]
MTLRFTLRQLEYFVAVGEEGSISRASDRVNVSSPSISSAITQLEKEFGQALFMRKHAHGLALSLAGQQFMAQAQRVLAEAAELNRLGGAISDQVQGPLRIGCLVSFAQLILPALRRGFEDQFPDVRVLQHELDHAAIIDRLSRAQIDLALSYDLALPPELEFQPLRELPPYAMVGEGHPLANRVQVTLEELADHDMVLLDLPLSTDYFLGVFEQRGLRPVIAERTKDIAVMRSLVANGFGYGIANIRPRADVAPDGRRIHFVPLKGGVRPMRLGLVLPQGAETVQTVQAFARHVEAVMGEWGYPGLPIPPDSSQTKPETTNSRTT